MTITLRDWNNETPITYLWICGVGCPTGQEFQHDTDTEDDEAYCDLPEIMDQLELWTLTGEIKGGLWCWDGEGDPRDLRGNTIYNVKAGRDDD